MNQPLQPTDAESAIKEVLTEIELNSIMLTQKFQAAVEAALDQCAKVDAGGNIAGFNFLGGRAAQLKTVTDAYQGFAAAEAARRTSTRPLPPPQINVPRTAGVKVPVAGPLTPALGTEPAGMEPSQLN